MKAATLITTTSDQGQDSTHLNLVELLQEGALNCRVRLLTGPEVGEIKWVPTPQIFIPHHALAQKATKQAGPANHRERQEKRRATPFDLRCPPGEECPTCGECNKGRLVWNRAGELVQCDTCSSVYAPRHWKPKAPKATKTTDWKALAEKLAEALAISETFHPPPAPWLAQEALGDYVAALNDEGKETP